MSLVQSLHFPPSGFGFWYYLGQYSQIQNIEYNECIGASSGALLCLCTLLDEDKKEDIFEFTKSLAKNTLVEYRNQTKFINLHFISNHFITQLFNHINWENVNISKIKIITTKVSFKYWVIPILSKVETVPETKEHLRELTLATTYIPFISNYNYKPYYTIHNEYFVDGGIIDFYTPSSYFSANYSKFSLSIPSVDMIYDLYIDGQTSPLTVHMVPSNSEFYLIHPFTFTLLLVLFLSIVHKR